MKSEFDRFVADDMYNHYLDGVETTSDSIVFDVGTYKGDSVLAMRCRMEGMIHGFEPIHSFWTTATQRVAHLPNVHIHNVGLGAEDEAKTLHLQLDGTSEFLTASSTERCIFRSFFNVWTALAIDRLDLLHMNVEGGEYAIFANLIQQGLLPKIRTVIVQFHYPDRFSEERRAIQAELRKTHDCVYDYAFVWERWNLREE
jgi:FkbM family methyltransferase